MPNIGQLVLYKNNHLIAFNKPVAIPVQGDPTGDKALINLAEIYCKSHLYLLHRIDRPTSGLVVFARTKKALAALNKQFQEQEVQKTYLAVVAVPPKEEEGELVHYLLRDGRTKKALVMEKETPRGKKAILSYRLVDRIDRYYLLEIKPLTGRFHQIRAQLAAIGSPIRGDVKYGFRRSNRDRSIHLHAWKMGFKHPSSGEQVQLEAPLPEDSIWDAFSFLQKAQ